MTARPRRCKLSQESMIPGHREAPGGPGRRQKARELEIKPRSIKSKPRAPNQSRELQVKSGRSKSSLQTRPGIAKSSQGDPQGLQFNPDRSETTPELQFSPGSSRLSPGGRHQAPEPQTSPGIAKSSPGARNQAPELQFSPDSSESSPGAPNRSRDHQI